MVIVQIKAIVTIQIPIDTLETQKFVTGLTMIAMGSYLPMN